MRRVSLQTTIDLRWTNLLPVRVGKVPSGLGTPDIFALVEADDGPMLRIDIYSESEKCLAFQEALLWQGYAVIGFSSHVYLVNLDSQAVRTYPMEGYFGQLYATEGYLLAASAECLTCIGPDGRLIWRSEPLGIDGVIVHDIQGETVYGDGEWDPPGGWRPFVIDLRTGASIPSGN